MRPCDNRYVRSENCGHELITALCDRANDIGRRTVVLIEEIGNEAVGYAPNWSQIRFFIERLGLKVVSSVDGDDGLIRWLDQYAVHAHPEPENTELAVRSTLHWFSCYGAGLSDALTLASDDLRVPWNIFQRAGSAGTIFDKATASVRLMSLCRGRPANSVTSGGGGCWIPANAATPPRPYCVITLVQLALAFIFCFLVCFPFVLRSFLGSWAFSAEDLWVQFIWKLGFPLYVWLGFLIASILFTIRWGDTITARGAHLHSPELFVPIVIRDLNKIFEDSKKSGDTQGLPSLRVRFVTPSRSQSPPSSLSLRSPSSPRLPSLPQSPSAPQPPLSQTSAQLSKSVQRRSHAVSIARNLCSLLNDIDCEADVIQFPGLVDKTANFSLASFLAEKKPGPSISIPGTVFVIFLETEDDLTMWEESQKKASQKKASTGAQPSPLKGVEWGGSPRSPTSAPLPSAPLEHSDSPHISNDQCVLIVSRRFSDAFRARLFKWMVFEFLEVGKGGAALSPSGTSSDTPLAGQILSAISVKLALRFGDLLKKGFRQTDAAAHDAVVNVSAPEASRRLPAAGDWEATPKAWHSMPYDQL